MLELFIKLWIIDCIDSFGGFSVGIGGIGLMFCIAALVANKTVGEVFISNKFLKYAIISFLLLFCLGVVSPKSTTLKMARAAVLVDCSHNILKQSESFNEIEGNLGDSLKEFSKVILLQTQEWKNELNNKKENGKGR